MLIFGVAAILGGLAPTYLLFLLTRLLAGVGMGGLFGLSFSMFAECWKTRRRGAMGGSIQAMYFVGEILTEGAIYFCIRAFGEDAGWRTGYVLIGAGTVVIARARRRPAAGVAAVADVPGGAARPAGCRRSCGAPRCR